MGVRVPPARLLLVLAAAGLATPAAAATTRMLMQQQSQQALAAAPAYETQPQPTYADIDAAGYGSAAGASGPSGGGAAGPAGYGPAAESALASTPTSPYRFADVGSANDAEVSEGIRSRDPARFAAAAASAGPEAAGRAVAEAIRWGYGPDLASMVDAAAEQGEAGAAAAADALLTGLWPLYCINPPAAAQTNAAGLEAGGPAAHAAAVAAVTASGQCCGSTLLTLSLLEGTHGGSNITDALAAELDAAGLTLPECATPPLLARQLGISGASATATAAPGQAPSVAPAAASVGALALGVAPLPEVPAGAIAAPGPAVEASQPLARPEYSASGFSGRP